MASFQWPSLTGSSSGVTSLNSLTGAITIVAGSGISVTPSGSDITIAATGAELTFSDSLVNTSGTVTLVGDSATPGDSKYYGTNSSGTLGYYALPTGTVTSVALSLPSSILTVSGSPVTTTGTLTGSLATQTANYIWAGPTTGSAAAPTFRALVAADLPSGTGTVTSVGLSDASTTPIYNISGSPVTTTGTLDFTLKTQTANYVFAGPTTGSAAQPGFRALVSADIPNNAANTTGNAATASEVAITTTISNSTFYPVLTPANTTEVQALYDANTFTFNPGTGTMNITTLQLTNALGAAYGGTGISTASSTGVPSISSGTWSVNSVLPISLGGTDNASLGVTAGGIIYTDGTKLQNTGAGTGGQYLASAGSSEPVWKSLTAPTMQVFTGLVTTTGFVFVVTSANATIGATYTNNSQTFTVLGTISSGTLLFTSGTNAPTGSGTLTKATGTGDSTISFSTYVALQTYTPPSSPAPLYIEIEMCAGGGGGGGSGTGSFGSGGNGGISVWGINNVVCNGGGGASGGVNTGAGGTASLGSITTGISIPGGSSTGGYGTTQTSGSIGGANPFGGTGGSAYEGNGINGIANTGAGGGGGGADISGGFAGSGGGAGGYVKAFISSPSATYFGIGSGGAGGAAGSSGHTGGNGGYGVLIVREYYQ